MASDRMMQAIGRLGRALARAETAAEEIAQVRHNALEAELEASGMEEPSGGVDIDPYSREKAIAALKSLDTLIGDLQKARSDG